MSDSDIIDEDGERVTDERFCAFTDDNGNGPDGVYLTRSAAWDEFTDRANLTERKLMLGIDRVPSDDPVSGFTPGCLTMTTDTATWLRDQLTAWLDAPRLAARATAEVVARDGKYGCCYELLRSSAGEWGVLWRDGDGSLPSVHWHTDERQAREEYAAERDMALCICGAECDADEIDRSGEEPQCPKCVTEAVAAFKAQQFACSNRGNGYTEACGWTGVGADLDEVDTGTSIEPGCPKCSGAVEEVRDV